MPRKKRGAEGTFVWEWKGFVDAKLTPSEKDAFREWTVTFEQCWGRLVAALGDGYKVSLSYEEKQGFVSASLTGREGTGGNAGYCLVARARDEIQAIRLLIFKHDVIYEQEWARSGLRAETGDDFE